MNPVGLIYFVLAVIGLIIIWASMRCLFKRLKCWLSIRRLCRRTGLRLHARPLWFLGSRYWKGIDFTLEGPDTVFSVKLFGCFWPLKTLVLQGRGEYFFRAHAAFLMHILDVFDGYPHTFPEYRFPEPGVKQQRNILLINPSPLDMLLQPSNGPECITGAGDMYRGMEIASLPHLLRIAENAARDGRSA